MAEIELRNVGKAYGAQRVLEGVDATFEKGSFSVVFGRPVSGKSVLMRLIMGLEPVDGGQVWLQGGDVTRAPAGTRNIGYVPQSFALYPHFRVADNIAYPLTLAGRRRDEIRPKVERLAQKLRITHLLTKYPNQLSGGEKQRVALARGMIKDTTVFVLDDPLVGLDFKLREQLFVDLRDMLSEVDGTFVYTTSDPLETLALADQVYVLDDRRIQEQGPLEELYYRPRQVRTLQQLGFPAANLVPGELSQGECRTPLGAFPHAGEEATGPRQVWVGFRPESVRFTDGETGPGLRADALTALREDLGAETLIYFESAGHRLVGAWSNGGPAPVSTERFTFGVPADALLVYDRGSGESLDTFSDRRSPGEKTLSRGEVHV